MDMISSMKGLAGGVLIGLSAVMLMAFLGRIAGISGITRGALLESGSDRRWRLAFVLGLISGPLLLLLLNLDWGNVAASTDALIGNPASGVLSMMVAGLLVGIGTGIGGGCTSGHGVCGIARLSPRSLVATVVFVTVAMLTVFVSQHLLGESP
ncbi:MULTISPECIES: YeeE/YedE family protein [unclassified Cobetia]|uniref:YeeE/YedE family protein n=1 Tax=unclassified Cobetia TaxID=2609414 RepID=UPI00178CEF34|nr:MULTISPECIES: YeeE/YedE family protein [unclassified Cobetia]MBE2167905.1 YeeE/YedE family protein [Cobetia sp. 2AS1]MDH2446329.1 YeeE/YedE family protein [Cobetia sp. 2AS]